MNKLKLQTAGLIYRISLILLMNTCFYGFSFSQINTIPDPDSLACFSSTIPFGNETLADGCAYTLFACDNHTGQLQNPIVITEGIDPGNNRWWPEIYTAMNQELMAEKLQSMGYDIVILNFGDGVDYVENNAMLLVELINRVNDQLDASGSDSELIVFGPSMGSLVVRYALAYMETNNMPHNTRLMIEFDGPNQGANLPNGYQYLLDFLLHPDLEQKWLNSIVEDKLSELSSSTVGAPATKQMLINHTDPFAEIFRYSLEANFQNVGDYPQNLRKVAIANGSGNGIGQSFEPGDLLFENEGIVYSCGGSFSAPRIEYRFKVYSSQGTNDYPEEIIHLYPDANLLFFGEVRRINIPFFPFSGNIAEEIKQTYSTSPDLYFDHVPGSFGGFTGLFQSGLNNLPMKNCLGPFLGVSLCTCQLNYVSTPSGPNTCFIPTISALDINTTDPFYNIHDIPGYPFPDDPSITPFDAIYAPDHNMPHVLEGGIDEVIAQWLIDEVGPVCNFPSGILSESYNFGFNDEEGMNYCCNTGNYIGCDLSIPSGIKLSVNNNTPMKRISQECNPPNFNSDFVLSTPNGDLHDPITITVENDGQILVGDEFSDNNGTFIIDKNCQLTINGGGKIIVRHDSQLIIKKGAVLNLDPTSYLELHNGAKVIIEAGAELNINSGLIEIGAGAQLIIHPDAKIIMNSGSEIKISDGGKLTIDYEGVMEYSGGDIFLNGATAEFELGGVVKVSGGSDFYLRNENPFANCGFLHITDAPYPESHFESIGTGNKLILEGSDMSNLILLLDDGAEFRSGSTINFTEISMQKGRIESGDDSRIVLSANNNILSRMTHHGLAGSRGIYVYRKNAFWNCDFNGSGKHITAINYYFNNQLRVYNSNFLGSASIRVEGGSFKFNNSTFGQGVFNADGITSPSTFYRCNVTDGMYINSTLNASTIKFWLCDLRGNTDFSSNNYIVNQGGKLEFSCNDILNYTIDATETLIDLSSFTNNGYNHFTNDHNSNRQYIILDNSTSSILWNNGYNTFESLLPDPQFRYVVPCGFNGTVNVKAYNNYWKNLPPNYESYIDEGPVQSRFEFWCTGGYSGSGIFNTGDPIDNGDTPCGYRSVRSAPSGIIGRKDVAEIAEDNPFHNFATRNEFVDPVLNTALLDSILLSEAIFLATNTMVFNDTLGNDFTAIDIFYDILTYDYDTLATDVDWMLDIAFANMKTTVENTFITDSITYADNTSLFHPAIQKYVDVLMIRSDDEITEDNYIDQFYLEIDKAQLFNVIGKKKMSWQLLNNLDNCPVDSIEQAYLNQWIYAIGQEMLSIQAGVDNYGIDSLVGQIDTTLFNSPSPIEADEFYFGAQILGVDMVTYANCNLISFRNTENNKIQSNDFSVYPNPTSGILTIAYQQEEDTNLNIIVYNLMGKLVLNQSIIGGHGLMQIDIGHLPQASYQYTISDGETVLDSGTIIKE